MENSIHIILTIYGKIDIDKITAIILMRGYTISGNSYIIHTFINITLFALIKKIRALFPFWYVSKITLFPTSSTLVEKTDTQTFQPYYLILPETR